MPERTKVAIIGHGNVGSALEDGLTKAGYEVHAVGKEPDKVRRMVQDAEVVFLAVPYAERKNAIQEAGRLEGKVVVDVTNATGDDNEFVADPKRSGAEEVQEMAKGAKVVKSFNMVFAPNMKKGELHGEKLSLFVAGDDEPAKRKVEQMGLALGFDPVDAGPLKNARLLEAMGYLNIQLGYGQDMGTNVGFRYVHDGA